MRTAIALLLAVATNNLQELVRYLKANPERVNLANAGLGAVSHLCGMLFQRALGVPEATGRVNAALRAARKDPNVVAKLKELGAEIVPESRQTPEALRTWLQSEIDKWGPVIRAAGVFAD